MSRFSTVTRKQNYAANWVEKALLSSKLRSFPVTMTVVGGIMAAFALIHLFGLRNSIPVGKPAATDEASIVIEACSASQLEIIQKQLPSEQCLHLQEHDCSFSYATRCSESTWLYEYYRETKTTRQPRQAIYVGCNKAMDAVNTMRMLSMNATYDKIQWKDAFFNSGPADGGVCGQSFDPNFEIPQDMIPTQVHVHCIEAMPATARELARTAGSLNYGSSLHVVHAAMSSVDGTIMFPDFAMGTEYLGIGDCTLREDGTPARECVEVPQYKLDTYVKNHVDTTFPIDILSIDVEGYDPAVLAGANETLSKVSYLEFEHHNKGAWLQKSLGSVVQELHEQDFVCYWAGRAGNLWRLTDCWLDYFNTKVWSNVACVKRKNTDLLRRMEAYFMATLAAGDAIQYLNASLLNTDGRIGAVA
jgi:FkbM family methyltransferase